MQYNVEKHLIQPCQTCGKDIFVVMTKIALGAMNYESPPSPSPGGIPARADP